MLLLLLRILKIFLFQRFSPNGDGQNDISLVHGAGISNYKNYMYDRIGEKVFETNDITQGWDGTYKGQAMNYSGVRLFCGRIFCG